MESEALVALATEFAELAAEIHRDGADPSPLRRIGELAVEHVGGCTWASVSEAHGDKARSLGASDPVATQLDTLQQQLGEGPCLQAASTGATVLCADLESERRWPSFVTQAREQTPMRCVLAVHLPGRDAAAMNFYADRAEVFDEGAVAAASILAAHAASLLVVGDASARSSNLETALRSNRQIGTAIGVLMALHKITDEEAFRLLRLASQVLHRKLRDVAAEVTQTGTLPDLPPASARTVAQNSIHRGGSLVAGGQ